MWHLWYHRDRLYYLIRIITFNIGNFPTNTNFSACRICSIKTRYQYQWRHHTHLLNISEMVFCKMLIPALVYSFLILLPFALALGDWNEVLDKYLQSIIGDRGLRYLWQNHPETNITEPYKWKVSIDLGTGLIPSDNKPLRDKMLSQIFVANWRYQVTIIYKLFIIGSCHAQYTFQNLWRMFVMKRIPKRVKYTLYISLTHKVGIYDIVFMLAICLRCQPAITKPPGQKHNLRHMVRPGHYTTK